MRQTIGRTAIALLLTVIGAIAGGAMLMAEPALAQQKKKKLSCSFIAKQCVTGCRKEAPGEFCETYCSSTRASCLMTGRWDGIRRKFTDVKKH